MGDADFALAQRLQAEEFQRAGIDPRHVPSGAMPLFDQREHVRRNVRDGLESSTEASGRMLGVLLFLATAELIATTVILSIAGGGDCDQPLAVWIGVFSARLLVQCPLWVQRYRLATAELSTLPVRRNLQYVNVISLVWFILGNLWLFNSDKCDNTIHTYALVLLIQVFVSIGLPFIIIALTCVCLPCLLVVMRFLAEPQGATEVDISRLKERTFDRKKPDGAAAAPSSLEDGVGGDETWPTCSICMNDFDLGDELRVLPCQHEFHKTCVDRWLPIKRECPLCRADINLSPTPATGAQSQPAAAEPAPAAPAPAPAPPSVSSERRALAGPDRARQSASSSLDSPPAWRPLD